LKVVGYPELLSSFSYGGGGGHIFLVGVFSSEKLHG
jgi:hypothetical protein